MGVRNEKVRKSVVMGRELDLLGRVLGGFEYWFENLEILVDPRMGIKSEIGSKFGLGMLA